MKPTLEQLEALQMQFWIQLQKLESSFQLAKKRFSKTIREEPGAVPREGNPQIQPSEQGAEILAATEQAVELTAMADNSTNIIHSEIVLEVQFAEQCELILIATEELLKCARTWNQDFIAKMVELSDNQDLQGIVDLGEAISKTTSALDLQSKLVNIVGRNQSLDNLNGMFGRDFLSENLDDILCGQAICEKPGAWYRSHSLWKVLAGCAAISALYFAAPYIGYALTCMAAALKSGGLKNMAILVAAIGVTIKEINDLREAVQKLMENWDQKRK